MAATAWWRVTTVATVACCVLSDVGTQFVRGEVAGQIQQDGALEFWQLQYFDEFDDGVRERRSTESGSGESGSGESGSGESGSGDDVISDSPSAAPSIAPSATPTAAAPVSNRPTFAPIADTRPPTPSSQTRSPTVPRESQVQLATTFQISVPFADLSFNEKESLRWNCLVKFVELLNDQGSAVTAEDAVSTTLQEASRRRSGSVMFSAEFPKSIVTADVASQAAGNISTSSPLVVSYRDDNGNIQTATATSASSTTFSAAPTTAAPTVASEGDSDSDPNYGILIGIPVMCAVLLAVAVAYVKYVQQGRSGDYSLEDGKKADTIDGERIGKTGGEDIRPVANLGASPGNLSKVGQRRVSEAGSTSDDIIYTEQPQLLGSAAPPSDARVDYTEIITESIAPVGAEAIEGETHGTVLSESESPVVKPHVKLGETSGESSSDPAPEINLGTTLIGETSSDPVIVSSEGSGVASVTDLDSNDVGGAPTIEGSNADSSEAADDFTDDIILEPAAVASVPVGPTASEGSVQGGGEVSTARNVKESVQIQAPSIEPVGAAAQPKIVAGGDSTSPVRKVESTPNVTPYRSPGYRSERPVGEVDSDTIEIPVLGKQSGKTRRKSSSSHGSGSPSRRTSVSSRGSVEAYSSQELAQQLAVDPSHLPPPAKRLFESRGDMMATIGRAFSVLTDAFNPSESSNPNSRRDSASIPGAIDDEAPSADVESGWK